MEQVKKIVKASLFKRTLAALLDLLIAAVAGLTISLPVTAIIETNPDLVNSLNEYYKECNDTHIFNVDVENESVNIIDSDSYKDYYNNLVYFYNTYLPSKFNYSITHDNYWFNVHVLGLEDVKNIYAKDELSNLPSFVKDGAGRSLFEYDVLSLDNLAIPKACNQDINKELTTEENNNLRKLFYLKTSDNVEDTSECLLYYAVEEFTNIDDVANLYNRYRLLTNDVPILLCIVLSFAFFYLIMPIILKRGKTLGKLIFKLSVLDNQGYEMKKSVLSLRMAPILSITLILVLMVGIDIFTIGVVSFSILASFICMIFSTEHEALHDKFFYTQVISDRESVWFKNREEEEAFCKK